MSLKLLVATALTIVCATARAQTNGPVLPPPEKKIQATVGPTYATSKPGHIPGPPAAPKGAPNVVVVLLDDVGFGATGTFGGPVPTPTFDELAGEGLRYNAFHTTALCSPTRAALLTGRNHHSVNSGVVTEIATGFEGYTSVIPKSAATLAEILRQNGYSTSAWGKWHNTPTWETSVAGPFDRWPTGLGFEYFYGFNAGETHQYHPTLYENTAPIETEYAKDRTLTQDLTDRVIAWMKLQKTMAPSKPFFVYWAPGATHAPHHVQKEWSDRFKGRFDQGWDVLREEIFARQLKLGVIPAGTRLTPRPPQIPSWDSMSPERKKIASRLMEIYAGFLAQTDDEIGRIVTSLKESGQWDNTLFIYIAGDNGASGEGSPYGVYNEMSVLNGVPEDPAFIIKNFDKLGGPEATNHYPVGFAWALDTPFQWTKQVASHLGGIRNGMVITWPKRIKEKNGLRSQFHHVIDIMPTILEATGVKAPSMVNGVRQTPIEGVSMMYTFDSAKSPSPRKTQYFEMFGNRAIYHDGWMASVFHGRAPWEFNVKTSFDDEKWELYDLRSDFSQGHDLAQANPKKLAELKKLFEQQAKTYHVFPLDDRGLTRVNPADVPSVVAPAPEVTYSPGAIRIPEPLTPNTKNKSYSVTARVVLPRQGADGVIAAIGGVTAGWSLYVKDGRPAFAYNYFNTSVPIIRGPKIEPGERQIRFDFVYDGGGLGRGGNGKLTVDGKLVAEGRIEKTVPGLFSPDETFDVGMDTGTPVGPYTSPFKFGGEVKTVILDTKAVAN